MNIPQEVAKIVLFDITNEDIKCYSACLGLGCMGWQGLPALDDPGTEQDQVMVPYPTNRGVGIADMQKPKHHMCEEVGKTVWSIQPCCQEYRVQIGEKLCEIAEKFDMSCEALRVLNDLEGPQGEEESLYQDYLLQIC
eukprot:TRINITY_DN64953_c1_g1_i5.p2 TRINITY_DN64953_c1_g1~~TRINITY_DN64953_c1_g1_i5.p2  ORF type:complete len:138 (+),score=24.03 TRINITY_DN64953_c1_g1_i5:99-512(+)